MQSDIDHIKSKLSIVDVVSKYVKLSPAGGSFKGLSPFTKEKTPSFFVSPDKGLYHCFSTGKGGDMFTFIQEVEGIEFVDALKMLALQAGVTLSGNSSSGSHDSADRIREVLEKATTLFEKNLADNNEVLAYVSSRGINEDTQRIFRIGYADASFDQLTKELKGIHSDVLVKAGLVRKKDTGRVYDYFRDRVMFPIFDAQGRIAGFSGRAFGSETTPKYLNSTDSPTFDKSSILYGLHRAKQSIRSLDCVIFVEGQVDLVLSHQIGFANTVAVSGTGLTEQHLKAIGHLTKNIIFAFDADKAGINSAVRGATKALPLGFNVKMLDIPSGKDPADYILEHGEEWKKVVTSARPVAEQIARMSERKLSSRERFLTVVTSTIAPLIALESSAVKRDKLIADTARAVDIDRLSLQRDVEKNISRGAHVLRRDEGMQDSTKVKEGSISSMQSVMIIHEWLKNDPNEKEDVFITEQLNELKELVSSEDVHHEPLSEDRLARELFWLDERFAPTGDPFIDRDRANARQAHVKDAIIKLKLERNSLERTRILGERRKSPEKDDEYLAQLILLDRERQELLERLTH